jgi:hypothetical protein
MKHTFREDKAKSSIIGISSLIFISLFVLFTRCQDPFPEKVSPIRNFSQLQEMFPDPPSDYRSAPLWDWNDKITTEGIDFHMQEFKKAGIGGVFVHPRPGLITEYLSEDWFELFDYTVQKGKELGMNVWIYDENSYPSGFAGGHVPADMPESWNQGTGLSLDVQEIFQPDTLPYEVILKKTGDVFTDISIGYEQEIGNEGTYYLFRKTYPRNSYWYGGYTYVDLLVPGVTEKFLDVTMTRGYEKLNASDFGSTLKGVFTDEPNLEAAMIRTAMLRWTPDLWDTFQDRWGYDLRTQLPSLVFETGDWRKVRHDYYELLLELFVDRWAIPWYQYCEENNLDWTGHYWEHGWPYPTHGFDEAAFYIWHQQPGVDMLGKTMTPGGMGGQFGNTRAVRELASAANQSGRHRTLSETYGGGGWEMDFAMYKRLADWQGILGVNFVNQHLSYYTLRGVRKFDYPPSFTYHEPWWEDYRLLGDYIGRLSLACSSGEQINDVLVLQPNTTAWMYFSRKQKNPHLDSIQAKFKRFVWELERNHMEYDLGSEYVIRTLGSVRGNNLIIGNRSYNLVILPSTMENMDSTTYLLLEKYLDGGGKIISFTNNIPYLDGAKSESITQLLHARKDQCLLIDDRSDPKFIAMPPEIDFSILESTPVLGELYHQRRILDDGQLLILVNSSADEPAQATVEAQGKSIICLNPISGEISQVSGTQKGNKMSFQVDLPPVGSAIYFISKNSSSIPLLQINENKVSELTPEGDIQISADQENILALNYLDLISGDLELKDVYFMHALLALFDHHGITFGNPWQHKIQYRQDYVALDTFPEGSGFEAIYHFTISPNMDAESLKGLKAVVEGHELWNVYINGHLVQKEEGAYWIDPAFCYFPIGAHLKKGINTITLKAPRMSIFAELMPVYLSGDFLVKPLEKGFEIINGALNELGPWKDQGYHFYAQKVSYSQTYNIEEPDREYVVKLKKWNGTTSEVYVNGVKAGQICWPPYELKIGRLLTKGENIITIKVVGSLKNTFGHFFRNRDFWISGPGDWNFAPDEIPSVEQYSLIDYGLFEPFELAMYEE